MPRRRCSLMPVRMKIVVALKDYRVPAIVNTTGSRLPFPDPGSVKALDTDGITVGITAGTRGVPTPLHFPR